MVDIDAGRLQGGHAFLAGALVACIAGVLLLTARGAQASGFSPTGSLAGGRYYHSATTLPGGKVLVAGGTFSATGSTFTFLASTELYDPATGTWSSAGTLTPARAYHASTLLQDGRVLLTGGCDVDNLGPSELYDPVTNTWSSAGDGTPTRRLHHTATLLQDGKVLAVGGLGGQHDETLASTEIFDPGTHAWTSAGNLTTGRSFHTATLLPNGKVLIAGGTTNVALLSTGPTATAELYDPGTNTWHDAPPMTTARNGHTATLLPNGTVLVIGGYGPESLPSGGTIHDELSSAEVYDPVHDTWTALAPSCVPTFDEDGNTIVPPQCMAEGRQSHTATLLQNGQVLVAGGMHNGLSLDSAELFDPTTNTFARTGTMTGRRELHSAARLANGKVLLAAGWNSLVTTGTTIHTLASAELYDPTSPVANLNLTGLSVSRGRLSPTFASSTTTYNTTVTFGVSSITITPTLADPTATVRVNGVAVQSGSASLPVALNPGSNAIGVLVTAQGGSANRLYTINVTRVPAIFRAYVSAKGDDNNLCTLQQPCRLLPAAIDAVNDGGEVWALDSANYNTSAVRVEKSVSVLGIPGIQASLVANGDHALVIDTPDVQVTLRNLTLLNLHVGSATPAGVLYRQGRELLVEGSEISGMDLAGIAAFASGGRLIVQNTVLRGNSRGVQVAGAVTATLDNIHVLRNTTGLFIADDARITLSRAVVANNSSGVSVQTSLTAPVQLAIDDSRLVGNVVNGIELYVGGHPGTANVSLTRNLFSNNGTAILASASSGSTATVVLGGNAITRNGTGIRIAGTGTNALWSRGNNAVSGNATNLSGGSLAALPAF